MEMITSGTIKTLNKKLNTLTLTNNSLIYYEITNLKINDKVRLFVFWISNNKALGFKTFKELQLFCSLKPYNLWPSLNDLHQIISFKNESSTIIDFICSNKPTKLASILQISSSDASKIINELKEEYLASNNEFFVC
ncbi:Hypothetical protein MALK_6450 [Metamycoplasma alkalescens 14918]|uniref:Uncharacterized protein n=1 Tax=Metamycoplasma alkalescens 14918 TaxID=1188234 RepID=N9TZ81_9BACT|nr:hypothetical protein [Metamycoplasma alkalescens]ENY53617.1 Hypothetical protein MALK_6450 [Metamycoplasma alkalescens 14918]